MHGPTERVIEPAANTFTLVGGTPPAPRAARREAEARRAVCAIPVARGQRDPAAGAILRSFPANGKLFTLFSS
jgi:hypothetical protein